MLKKVQWFGITLLALAVLGSTDYWLDFMPKGWMFLTFMWSITLWVIFSVSVPIIRGSETFMLKLVPSLGLAVGVTFAVVASLYILGYIDDSVIATMLAVLWYLILVFAAVGFILPKNDDTDDNEEDSSEEDSNN